MLDPIKGELYLTPKEVLSQYPDLVQRLNWTTIDIGHLLKCTVLEGYYDRSKRISMIKESSLKRLIAFINANLEAKKVRM